MEKETLVINMFGGPGAGKTTAAWEIAAELKKRGYVAEYVPEFAKELVWDGKTEYLDGTLDHQGMLLREQKRRIDRLVGKVDFIVTDSPIMLNASYFAGRDLPKETYEEIVVADFGKYNNFCVFVERGKDFEKEGRIHDLEQSKAIDKSIKQLLDRHKIFYVTYFHKSVPLIADNCIKTYARVQKQPTRAVDVPTPNTLTTGDRVQTRRGNFRVTALSYDQMELIGYGLHHQSEGGKYFIMSNGTDSYAVASDPTEIEKLLEKVKNKGTADIEKLSDGVLNNFLKSKIDSEYKAFEESLYLLPKEELITKTSFNQGVRSMAASWIIDKGIAREYLRPVQKRGLLRASDVLGKIDSYVTDNFSVMGYDLIDYGIVAKIAYENMTETDRTECLEDMKAHINGFLKMHNGSPVTLEILAEMDRHPTPDWEVITKVDHDVEVLVRKYELSNPPLTQKESARKNEIER